MIKKKSKNVFFLTLFLVIIFFLIKPEQSNSSEKNITYMQILQNPNDLDLNLKYAQQQGKMGNYKQTISTLERLNMIYPNNIEIKLYLLSILVQIDSPEKANTIIQEMKLDRDLASEDLETLQQFEEELKDREPGLWTFIADFTSGAIHTDNVNNVSKTRTKSSSDSRIGFNSAKYDSTFLVELDYQPQDLLARHLLY
tara:strand:- start:1102 stop:1695 length:594 start_codon:yes stop_codon:yes gene_type:complete